MIPCFLITASALIQLLLTIWFRGVMRQRNPPNPLPPEHQHSTWIVLSVRGADPTLKAAVRSLSKQHFGDYRICVVVDNKDDPAAKVLESVAGELPDGKLVIRHLQVPLPNCTLKCSAIAEGIEYVLESDPDVKYFVMVDADSNPPETMLTSLLGGLHSDPQIGLVSGNQWFEPNAPTSVGSLVRSMWYAGALFFSMLFENPWAGAYAMRASDIKKTGLIDCWRKSAVDDGPLKRLFFEHDMKCKSVPGMIVVNREPCTLRFVTRWMTRILTWSRIHEPAFWLTAFQMVYATSLIIVAFATFAWAILCGDLFMTCMTAIAIVVSGILSVLAWTTIRKSVIENSVSAKEMEPVTPLRFCAALLTVGIAQAVYAVACTGAIFARRTSWRGVTYSIASKGVTLESYKPYKGSENSEFSI